MQQARFLFQEVKKITSGYAILIKSRPNKNGTFSLASTKLYTEGKINILPRTQRKKVLQLNQIIQSI